MTTIRLTAAQAMVRYLSKQMNGDGVPFIAGCWAIFGHGNVAGLGEALHAAGDSLPTWRGHNEQGMAHAAIAFAKASNRRRAMAVAQEQEMKALVEQNRAKVVEAEAQIPKAISEAFRAGHLGVMDYYNMRNVQADTEMRNSISGRSGTEEEPKGDKGHS